MRIAILTDRVGTWNDGEGRTIQSCVSKLVIGAVLFIGNCRFRQPSRRHRWLW